MFCLRSVFVACLSCFRGLWLVFWRTLYCGRGDISAYIAALTAKLHAYGTHGKYIYIIIGFDPRATQLPYACPPCTHPLSRTQVIAPPPLAPLPPFKGDHIQASRVGCLHVVSRKRHEKRREKLSNTTSTQNTIFIFSVTGRSSRRNPHYLHSVEQ